MYGLTLTEQQLDEVCWTGSAKVGRAGSPHRIHHSNLLDEHGHCHQMNDVGGALGQDILHSSSTACSGIHGVPRNGSHRAISHQARPPWLLPAC